VSRSQSADIYIAVQCSSAVCNNNPGLFTGRALKRTWARMRSFLLMIGGSSRQIISSRWAEGDAALFRALTDAARTALGLSKRGPSSRTLEVAPPDHYKCSPQSVALCTSRTHILYAHHTFSRYIKSVSRMGKLFRNLNLQCGLQARNVLCIILVLCFVGRTAKVLVNNLRAASSSIFHSHWVSLE
jgi:hypothetical protein